LESLTALLVNFEAELALIFVPGAFTSKNQKSPDKIDKSYPTIKNSFPTMH
jgi:hypothetical protein